MSAGPASDADVPSYWRDLGLPGLVDVHVHFMPARVLAKVWAYFDGVEAATGVAWPIAYREDEAARLARLRAMGVRAFPSLVYPHKPGMAAWLNDWAAGFAAEHDDVVPTATFFPEPGVEEYVDAALRRGARLFKVHLQVGAYDPRDSLLRPVWARLEEAAVPVVVHCGSGPLPGPFTGPEIFREVLERHPALVAVVAHMGNPEYAEFVELAQAFPRVHLDTTMAFTDFTERVAPYPRQLLPALAELADRVVLGSDFPNTPYPYSHQIAALAGLGMGDAWLRGVLHDNGARLLRLG